MLEPRLPLATFYWVGPGAGAWSSPANWQDEGGGSGSVPSSSDTAHFDNDATVDVPSGTTVDTLELAGGGFSSPAASVVLIGGSLSAQSVKGAGNLKLDSSFHLESATVDVAYIKVKDDARLDVTGNLHVQGTTRNQRLGLELDGGHVRVGNASTPSAGRNAVEVFPKGVMILDGDVVAAKLMIYGDDAHPGEVRQSFKTEIRPPGDLQLDVINSGRLVLLHASDAPNRPVVHELKIFGNYFQTSKAFDTPFAGELEFVIEPPSVNEVAQINPTDGGRLNVLHQAQLRGKITLNTEDSRFYSYAATVPRSVGWARLILYGNVAGRFDTVVGSQFHFFNFATGTQDIAHDRFLGLNFQEKFVDLMLLETPQLLQKIDPPGIWDTTIPATGNPFDPADGTRKFRLTPDNDPKDNLVLIVPGTADSVAPTGPDMVTSKAMNLARDIAAAVDKTWDVAVLEWREWNTGSESDPITGKNWKPWTGSTLGINIGESLAHWMIEAGLKYKQLHLISHSGGSWLVDALADELTRDPGDEWIHMTLFDAFTPFENGGAIASSLAEWWYAEPNNISHWGGADPELADNADYAEQFVDTRQTLSPFSSGTVPILAPAVPFTNAWLQHAFNYDVTALDPLWVNINEGLLQYAIDKDPTIFGQANLTTLSRFRDDKNIYRGRSHSWPYFFYIDSAESPDAAAGSRYKIAFPNSLEHTGHPQTYDEFHPEGGHVELGLHSFITDPPFFTTVPIDESNTTVSATGTVTFHPESGLDVELATGSPVSVTTAFTASQPVDDLKFDFDFLSQSEGQFSISIDGVETLRLAESDLLQLGTGVFRDWILALSQELPAGEHTVTFLLDPQQGGPSRMQIGNVRWGQESQTPILPPYPHPWTNFPQPNDVNNDSFIAPLDALRIINELNSVGARALRAAPFPNSYVDVNGDDFVSPIDALIVINYLNSLALGEGESPPGMARESSSKTEMPGLPRNGAIAVISPGTSAESQWPDNRLPPAMTHRNPPRTWFVHGLVSAPIAPRAERTTVREGLNFSRNRNSSDKNPWPEQTLPNAVVPGLIPAHLTTAGVSGTRSVTIRGWS